MGGMGDVPFGGSEMGGMGDVPGGGSDMGGMGDVPGGGSDMGGMGEIESISEETILEADEGKFFNMAEPGMESIKDNVILEPMEGKPVPAMETTRDESIFQPAEAKHFETAESWVESAREGAILGATEGKWFDIAEPGMEITRDEAVLQPTAGKYFDTVEPGITSEQLADTKLELQENLTDQEIAFQSISDILRTSQDASDPMIENVRGAELETGEEGVDLIEQTETDPDAPMQDDEIMPPQDGEDLAAPPDALKDGEAEENTEGNEASELKLPDDWHLYSDKDGNDIIVDENGKPVEGAPIVYDYQGKKYLAYPGDAPAVDETGKVVNPQNLIEAPPDYEANINDMYIHEGQDGNLTVVDKNGKPVDSPPMIVEHNISEGGPAVKYLAYPGTKLPFDEKGSPTGEKLNPLQYYNADISDMYVHEGSDGKLTVVDKDGKPVDSPPMIIEHNLGEGGPAVKYLAYPGTKLPFDEKGSPTGEELNPLKYYIADIIDMYIHEGSDGKLTVVDKNGKPVDSPPMIVEHNLGEGGPAVKYLAYPGTKLPFDEKGSPTGEKLNPLKYYSASIDDMYIHEGADGKVTVVDKNGKPVESPPMVMEYDPNNDGQTVKYLAYPGTKPPFDESGKPTGEKLNPAQHYQGSTNGLYMHEDGDGKITVVDEKGQPVDSPPDIIQLNGKYYMAYPGTKEAAAIKPDGTINAKDAKEITYYKPDWWAKNVTQNKSKGA